MFAGKERDVREAAAISDCVHGRRRCVVAVARVDFFGSEPFREAPFLERNGTSSFLKYFLLIIRMFKLY